MEKSSKLEKMFVRRILLAVCLAVLVLTFMIGLPKPVSADVPVPPVPANLEVPAGNRLFFRGHAVGFQNYVCQPVSGGFGWTLYTPQAILFNGANKQVSTHFFSPNPMEPGSFRPTWVDSRDSSTVWARLKSGASTTDPAYVEPGAIAWLTLEVLHTQPGPDGGDRLTVTTFIQRLNTSGGVAPSTGCAVSGDVGRAAYVPYEADYFFYKRSGR